MPRDPSRFHAAFTRHRVSVVIGEDVRYRVEQLRTRLVEYFEDIDPELTNQTFEDALKEAIELGLEYSEALEGLVADVVDGHLFKSTHKDTWPERLRQQLSDHGRCNIRGQSVNTIMKLLASLDPSATVVIEAGELRVEPPQPQENL